MEQEWIDLRDTIWDTAEGYAVTDPRNAWLYREEAVEFGRLPAPDRLEAFENREAYATTLRLKWAKRISDQRQS